MSKVDVGLRIRLFRERAGMTQDQLARASGVGSKTISSYESGARVRSLKISHLERLCIALQITVYEFFDPRNEIENDAPDRPFTKVHEEPEPPLRRERVDPLSTFRTSDRSPYPSPQSSLGRAI